MTNEYNGAWWYLCPYVILMLIPAGVALLPVRKLNWKVTSVICLFLDVAYYLIKRFGYLPSFPATQPILRFLNTEFWHLFYLLAWYWAGALLCKHNVVSRLDAWMNEKIKHRDALIVMALLLSFVVYNLLEKSVLTFELTVFVFLAFNLWRKPTFIEKCFHFLGKHSTNIWLTHMFFYGTLFKGLVQRAEYPVLILLFMLALTVVVSYLIFCFIKLVDGFLYNRTLIRK